MKILTFKIDKSLQGRTIENILKHRGFSSSLIKRLKAENSVTLNGEHTRVIQKAAHGDIISVSITNRNSQIVPSNISLDIIFEDEDIILINKPRSMPTHPSGEHSSDTLANALMYYFGSSVTFHPITRLDKNTSGVVLVAKNPLAAHILTKDMLAKKIRKEYVAYVHGTPNPLQGTISAPIVKMQGIKRAVSEKGKEAVTTYETLSASAGFSYVRLLPLTGRTHQLRVHMSHIGHPIYGDYLYNPHPHDGKTRLHCLKLTFNHPSTKEEMIITAPLPLDMTALMNT